MKLKMNLKNNFKTVEEGERRLKITKAECTPSGLPNKLKVTFQDSEGGFINSQYNFDNDKSLFAMGKLLEVALEFKDGDEFDTKTDCEKLVGIEVLAEVYHSYGKQPNENGELPVFANIRKVINKIDSSKEVVETVEEVSEVSPRNQIADSGYDI